ncbi:MAG: hypothetical protein IJO15_01950, partial [Clostridia bacterium]|nr:hypothetical protein [Clostridia bacterium]
MGLVFFSLAPVIPNELLFFAPLFSLLGAKHSRNLTLFGFSLFCPCFASLHLPQAALGSALTEEKKAAK